MGWIGTETDQPGHERITEEIEWGGKHTVIKRSGKYYAVRNNETGEVSAVVGLVQRKEGWVYTKLVDEDMGPNEHTCPKSLLNLLSPTTNEYALSWRESCSKICANKLSEGDSICVTPHVSFSDGVNETEFRFVKRYTFIRASDGRLVSLPKHWKTTYNWKIAKDVDA